MHLQLITPTTKATDPLYASTECQELLQATLSYYDQKGYAPPWAGYLVMEGSQVLGTCAFTGEPQNGRVELAYYTFPAHEGKGVASFACRSLIAIAHNTAPELEVIAKTAPEENASVHILRKNGFVYSEVVQDHEIGDAWLWVLAPSAG